MSQATSYEQLMLELVNRERAKTGAQPLAFNGNLNDSADAHSGWMISADVFNHTGSGGSTPHERMIKAGYSFSGSWASAENIAWASLRSPTGLQDEVEFLHTNLMNSPGHKANILNGSYQEIGIGFQTGAYQTWDGAFVTQNFARSGTQVFLTGVTMDDKDGDRFYDIGEGLGGLTVTAVSASGARYSTTSQEAGGYSLTLTPGTYAVTFSGGGFSPVTHQVTVGSANVKLDLIDPSATTTSSTANDEINGTAVANTLYGTTAANVINGLGGATSFMAGPAMTRFMAAPATTGSSARREATAFMEAPAGMSCPAAQAAISSTAALARTPSASPASGERTKSPISATVSTVSTCAATA
jgi:hypothetical protein